MINKTIKNRLLERARKDTERTIKYNFRSWYFDVYDIKVDNVTVSPEEVKRYLSSNINLDTILEKVSKTVSKGVKYKARQEVRDKLRVQQNKELQKKQALKIALEKEQQAKQELEKKLFTEQLTSIQKAKLRKLWKVKFPNQ